MPATLTAAPQTLTADRFAVDYPASASLVASIPQFERHLDHTIQSIIFDLVSMGYTRVSIGRALDMSTPPRPDGTFAREAVHHAVDHALRSHCDRIGVPVPTRRRRPTPNRAVAAPAPGDGLLILGRCFGVEVEYNGDYRYCGPYPLADALTAAGIAAANEGYNHQTRNHWKCTTDATVTGGECVSPILRGTNAIEDVRTVMQTISRLGGTVGSSCGTHVHHDIRDFDRFGLEALVHNMRNCHYALLSYIPDNRIGRSYSNDMSRSQYDRLAEVVANGRLRPATDRTSDNREGYTLSLNRYVVFNWNSVLTYGTVEFRAHAGTLNATKLEAWVGVGQAIIEFSRRGHHFDGVQSAESMLDRFVAEGLLHRRLARRFRNRVTALHGADRLPMMREVA